VLQCVAVCCSVLQCAAVCCSVLQCVAVCCSVLQYVADLQSRLTKFSFELLLLGCCQKVVGPLDVEPLRCCYIGNVIVCCSVLQCVAVCCSELQCVAVCCSVLHICNVIVCFD